MSLLKVQVGDAFLADIVSDTVIWGRKNLVAMVRGMESIARIMDTVGVTKLSDLEGRYIRTAVTGDRRLKIIGNIINDKWFDIKSFFEDAQENDNKVSEGSNK